MIAAPRDRMIRMAASQKRIEGDDVLGTNVFVVAYVLGIGEDEHGPAN